MIANSENSNFIKMVLVIGLPILLQNFISAFVNFVDTIMVGTLGDTAVAAVGAANQIYFVLNLIILGVSSGIAVFMAQYWGKKDLDGLKKSLVFGLSILLVFVVIVTGVVALFSESSIGFFTNDVETIGLGSEFIGIVCWSYVPAALSVFLSYSLRSIERVKISVRITVVALLLNVVLNYLLIFGVWIFPELGVRGAAIATVIARVFQAVAIILAIYLQGTAIAIKSLTKYVPDRSFVSRFVSTSGSVFLNEVLYGVGNALFFAILGRISIELFAGANIGKQVETLIWIFFWSMCAVASITIGKLIGEEDYKRAQDYAKKFMVVGFIISGVLALFLVLLLPFILSLFNVSAMTKDITRMYLLIFAGVILFRGPVKILTGGVMRAGGDTFYVLLWDVIPQYLAILVSYILVEFTSVSSYVVVIVLLGYEIIKVIPTVRRVISGKWINNVVN